MSDQQQAPLAQVIVLEQLMCQRLTADWQQASQRVESILRHTVRARSAVECMHRVLRMHQSRQRHVSQGLLDLKRLCWNCRPFVQGKRRGACPYALLGLDLPTYDGWELVQMDPDVLRQKLSTQDVRT